MLDCDAAPSITGAPTYARHLQRVTATLALTLAISTGGAYAANTLLPKNSVTSKAIKNGQVKAKDIGKNAVNGNKIANNGLTGADVRTGSLAGSDIADGSLSGVDIADGSLGLSKLTAAERATLLTQLDRAAILGQTDARRFSPIPSGTLVRGAGVIRPPFETNTATDVAINTFINPGVLPRALTASDVKFGATTGPVVAGQEDPATCAGTAAAPAPKAGALCVYPVGTFEVKLVGLDDGFTPDPNDSDPADVYGAELVVQFDSSVGRFAYVWAYAAP